MLTVLEYRPMERRLSKNDGKILSGYWNAAVDEYIVLGADHRSALEIEQAAKLDPDFGPLWKHCEASGCNELGHPGLKMKACAGCKRACTHHAAGPGFRSLTFCEDLLLQCCVSTSSLERAQAYVQDAGASGPAAVVTRALCWPSSGGHSTCVSCNTLWRATRVSSIHPSSFMQLILCSEFAMSLKGMMDGTTALPLPK